MKIFNKKQILSMMLAVLLMPAAVSAGVYFMEAKDESTEAGTLVIPCLIDYPKTSCPEGKTPQNFCPTDNRYFKTCSCDTSVYQYTTSNCTGNKTLGGGTCDSKYATCTCDAKYQYTTSNCTGGKALSGNQCDSKYEACGCAVEYSKTCDTGNLIPTDSGDSCDGKYKSCKCPTSYITCDNGGAAGADQCTEENGTVKYASCKAEKTCQEWISETYPNYKIITGSTISGDLDSGTVYNTQSIVIMRDIDGPFTANNALSYVTLYNPSYFSSEFSACQSDYKIKLNTSGKNEFAINNVRFYTPIELVDGISIVASGTNEFNKSVKTDGLTVKSGSTTTLKADSEITLVSLNQGSTINVLNGTYSFGKFNLTAVGSDTGKTIINMTNSNVTFDDSGGINTAYFDSLGVEMTLKDTNLYIKYFSWQGTYAAGSPEFKLIFDGKSKMITDWVYARGEGLYIYFTQNASASGAQIVSVPARSFSLTPRDTSAVAYFRSRTGTSNSMYQQTDFCSYTADAVKNFKECTDFTR